MHVAYSRIWSTLSLRSISETHLPNTAEDSNEISKPQVFYRRFCNLINGLIGVHQVRTASYIVVALEMV